MRTVKLVKFNKNTNSPEVKLMVSPSVSKYNGDIIYNVATVINGNITKLGTFTANQLKEFCYKVIELINTIETAETLFGRDFVIQKINEFYQNNQQQPYQQPQQPVYNQPVQQPTYPQTQQPVYNQPQQPVYPQSQTVNQQPQPVYQQPYQQTQQPVYQQQYQQPQQYNISRKSLDRTDDDDELPDVEPI